MVREMVRTTPIKPSSFSVIIMFCWFHFIVTVTAVWQLAPRGDMRADIVCMYDPSLTLAAVYIGNPVIREFFKILIICVFSLKMGI